jgi:RNA-directed DNA polymerase
VRYFRIGNSSDCFSFVKRWVEQKVRRHVMRARGRAGFGWRKWSMAWVYRGLGLFDEYLVRYYTPRPKAPSAEGAT